jgi:hypothetical protein
MRHLDPDVEAGPERPRWRGSAPPVLVALLLFGVIACWSLGTPLGASPDEPSHTVKAVAVARGEFFGDLGPVPVDRSLPGAITTVRIPFAYVRAAEGNCYAFQPNVPASCQVPIPVDHTELVDATTAAGHYPPLYYLLVGLPSLVLPADIGVYAMRLMSAAITTLFFAWGMVALLSRGSRRMTLWSVAVGLTPMCLFLSGTINPNGLEIATAFSVWSASLALFSGRSNASARSLWLQLGISAAVLVNIRALSPLWAVVAIGVSALSADSSGIRAALRSRWAVPVLGAIAVTTAVGLSWTVRHGALLTGKDLWPEYNDRLLAIRDIIGSTSSQYLQMVGNMGWLDAASPPLTVVSWTVALGALTALAFAAARMRRAKLALVVLLLGVYFGPMILELPAAADAGLVWQGRYTLPIAVGVPLLAGVVVGDRRVGANPLVMRLARMMVPFIGLANVAAFYWTMRRYSVGATGALITGQPDWSSPLGYLPAIAIYATLVAALCILALRSTVPDTHHQPGPNPSPLPLDAGRLAVNPWVADDPVSVYPRRVWSIQSHRR